MISNIKDYICVKNIIPTDVCNELIDTIDKSLHWKKHQWQMYGKPVDPTFPNRDFDVLDATAEIQEMLYPYLSQAIQNYNTIISKENSFESFISTASVTRCCQVRFNRYKKNTLMRTHHDHIHNLFDGEQKGIPILSIVGLLNNDFSGGDFIFFDNYNVKLTAGDVMIFPSSFLYPHRVEEITGGTRHAFVSWAY
jgi:hypothetical protein